MSLPHIAEFVSFAESQLSTQHAALLKYAAEIYELGHDYDADVPDSPIDFVALLCDGDRGSFTRELSIDQQETDRGECFSVAEFESDVRRVLVMTLVF